MDQQIFKLGLSVPATSLYLLIDSLSDSGARLNRETVLKVWNAGPEQLDQAFTELVARRIAGADASGAWFVRPASEWA
ncbi:MAG: hypothetical protein ACOZHQ_17800 [Thermodesulfobacteriota bacterium]